MAASAAPLNVQPSALSRRIAELEHHLGVRLFERLPFGVRLTREGRRFLEGAREGLDHIGRASRAAGETARRERSTLRIGLSPGVAPQSLFDAVRAVLGRWPHQELVVAEGLARAHRLALANRDLDVALVPGDPRWEGCNSRIVRRERLVVACHAAHRLAAATEVRWRDLRDECVLTATAEPGPQIARHVRNLLAGERMSPAIRPQAVSLQTLLQIVGMGQGLAVTLESPSMGELPGVVLRPIAGEVWPFSALWSVHNTKPALRKLLGFIESEGAFASASPAAKHP